MAFKFTFLGLERTKDNCKCEEKIQKPNVTKRKKSNSKKSIKQREKFTKAVQICHRKTKDKDAFGRCMSKELKK